MTSAAILMAVGAEQVGARPLSADLTDQGELQGVSFAKSLSERFGGPLLLEGKNPAADKMDAVSVLKGPVFAKASGVVDTPAGAKGKTVVSPETPIHDELESVVTGKIAETPKAAEAGSQDGTVADDSGVEDVTSSAQAKETASGASVNFPISQMRLTAGFMDESVPHAGLGDGDRSTVLSGDRKSVV